MSELEALVDAAVLRLRLVVGALILGVALFTAVAVLLVHTGTLVPPGLQPRLFRTVLPALAAGCVAGFLIFQSRARRSREDAALLTDDQIIGAHTSRSIAGAAMAEANALCAGIGYLFTADDWLLLGIALAVAVMASFLPSRNGLLEVLRLAGRPV